MIRAAVVTAAVFAFSSPLVAHEPWRAVDAETGQIRDIEGLEQLAQDFPDSGSVRLRMLQPLLQAGEKERLLQLLSWLKARGYVFGEVAQGQIPKLLGEEYAQQASELLLPKASAFAASELIAIVPPEAGLVETALSVGEDQILAVSSVTENAVFRQKHDGSWKRIENPGANDVTGIVRDPASQMLWFSSSNVDESDDEKPGFIGLVAPTNDPSNPMMLQAPDAAMALSDLTVGADGSLYVSDPLGGGVYFGKAGDDALQTLIAPGTFRSPQGLALSEDGSKLYVSDYRYGIATIELETKKVFRLGSDVPVILDGVDGLWRYGDELIAVQNGTSPMRISGFKLSDDGTKIVGHRVLEQANPDWTEPLGGSIDGDALIYVGNGQWDRFVKGIPAQDKPAIPTQIRRLPLK